MTQWLIDKSAFVRMSASSERAAWDTRIGRGLVWITSITLLEIGYSGRTGKDIRNELESPPLALMPVAYTTPEMENRAIEVQALLADNGTHRAPSVADVMIAAIAERNGFVVLHDDKDFGLIADVTGQSVERLR